MRIQSKSRNYVFFAACAALACVTSPAFAADEQPGLALDRFNPSYAGDRFFGVTSPFAAGGRGVAPCDYIVRGDQPYRTLAEMYFAVQNYAPQNPRPAAPRMRPGRARDSAPSDRPKRPASP